MRNRAEGLLLPAPPALFSCQVEDGPEGPERGQRGLGSGCWEGDWHLQGGWWPARAASEELRWRLLPGAWGCLAAGGAGTCRQTVRPGMSSRVSRGQVKAQRGFVLLAVSALHLPEFPHGAYV